MPSIFSRARTTSSSKPLPSNPLHVPPDEFGRVPSRGPSVFNKKSKTLDGPLPPEPVEYPEGSFLPLYLSPSRDSSSSQQEYGYIACERDVILGVDEVLTLLQVLNEEINERGLTTPRLLSPLALDINTNRIRSLIRSFLSACSHSATATTEAKWREEARFAGSHELGMMLKWGIARLIRIEGGVEVRGFIPWDAYLKWRTEEEALRFPESHFSSLLPLIPPLAADLLLPLLVLMSRLCAHSSSSGLTPTTIATNFGPLLFGLGSATSMASFATTYTNYLKSTHACEHILLAYIRYTDHESRVSSGGTGAISIPARLRDWITGYPNMLPKSAGELEKPRRGMKMVKITSLRRNLRLYSADLVKTSATWFNENHDVAHLSEWQRVVPTSSTRTSPTVLPQYSDAFRKRLDLPPTFLPSVSSTDRASLDSLSPMQTLSPATSFSPSLSSSLSSARTSNTSLATTDTSRFRNLTDLKWGEFEQLGFSSTPTPSTSSLLQFDLTESARMAALQPSNAGTVTWTDFSSSGFSSLSSATLQFSSPIASSIHSWPEHEEDIHKKLRKVQKQLPAFGWDTNPVIGKEWMVEEGIIGAWCEFSLSSGWVDWKELTFREANWALVEFKCLPSGNSPNHSKISLASPTATSSQNLDPRTATQTFLFEEFVPLEYRSLLTTPAKKNRPPFLSLKSSKSKSKDKWQPATTLNGRPYTGRPSSPTPVRNRKEKEREFDALLREGPKTKLLSLSPIEKEKRPISGVSKVGVSAPLYSIPRDERERIPPLPPARTPPPRAPGKDFGGPLSRLKQLGSGNRRAAIIIPSEYDPTIEFETRTASDSSGGESPSRAEYGGRGGTISRKERRMSKDDAWVDILVADRDRRNVPEPAVSNGSKTGNRDRLSVNTIGGFRRSRSDPEMAREEIQRALVDADLEIERERERELQMERDRNTPLFPRSEVYSYAQEDDRTEDGRLEDDADVEEVMEVPAIRVRSPTISTVNSGDRSLPVIPPSPTPPPTPPPHSPARGRFSDEGNIEPAPRFSHETEENDAGGYVPAAQPESFNRPGPASTVSPLSGSPKLTKNNKPLPLSQPKGVSSLIEMYQSKDRNATASPTPQLPRPSKLPVRTSSLGSNSVQSPVSTTPTITPPPPPPIPDVAEIRVPSPARYVHGLPLQNVLEEEDD